MLTALLRRDRAIVVGGLLAVIALAWIYLLLGAGIEMDQMDMGDGQMMLMAPEWTPGYAALIFLMWAIMMMAMMLPSAAPAILLVAALMRQRAGRCVVGPTLLFVIGYAAVWSGFSLAATALQWWLDRAGLLSVDMASGSVSLAGALLIAAGLYQWTPFKQSCLAQCRAPAEHLTRTWRRGPVFSGASHGLFCLGCCWVLMGVLFVGGLMNVLWVAGVALLVLIEKALPAGPRLSRLTGAALIGWGAIELLR